MWLLATHHKIQKSGKNKASHDSEDWKYSSLESRIAVETKKQIAAQAENAPKNHELEEFGWWGISMTGSGSVGKGVD